MENRFLIAIVILALVASTSVADMSAGTKSKINTGIASGKGVVDFLSKLGDPKTQKVFDSLGKMASFLGAFGGVISFALLFVPQQDSAELKFMKEKFAEVNMKLDQITTELDKVKDLITYENQRAAYLSSAARILHGHKRLQEFLNEMQRTSCYGESACKRVRARIASRFVNDFNIASDIFKIINGATKPTSAFGDPLLNLVSSTFKCHIVKIDQFANSILKLSFKAQQVILAHEKLTGSSHSITQSMNNWLKSIYELRDKTTAVKTACFQNIRNQMITDINEKKYQVGVPSNDAANIALKRFMDDKYPWLGWTVYSYGAYGGSKHHVTNVNGALWNMPSDRNERKRNIIVSFTDKHGTYANQKYKVLNAIDEMIKSTNFYSVRNNAGKLLPKVEEELKKESVWKYVNSLNILRQYDGLTFKAGGDLTYLSEEYTFSSYYMYKGRKRFLYDKVRLVITLKSEEKANGKGCDLDCNSKGDCALLPYSSAQYCQCKPFYQGNNCKDQSKAQLAKTMDAMLAKTLKLPMLSDIAYDIKDLREYVGVSFGALQAAVSELEKTLQNAFDKLSQQLSNQFEWTKLISQYSHSIQKVKYYAYRFESLPTQYASRIEEEGKKLATAVLASDGIEKWLYDVNFLFVGKRGTPVLNHQPMMITFMNKYQSRACSAQYRAAVDSTWRQLVLLQQIGYMLWAQALEFDGRSSDSVKALYETRTSTQVAEFTKGTCVYSIPNSVNVQCSGGRYLHPGITLTTQCKTNYYVTGTKIANCVTRRSGCAPCYCNAAGSNGLECSDITGKCSCKSGFYGDKCRNRNCVWSGWSRWSGCNKGCGYGGQKSKTRYHQVTKQGRGSSCTGTSSAKTSCFNRCCSNEFHCSNKRKCIPLSYKCDYDNNCGDKQDEQSCQEHCTTKYTGWNSHGGGKSVYLDRHRLNCGGAGNVLSMFHLERSGGKIRYKYTCCKLNKPTTCSLARKTNSFTYDGNDDTVYFDRQSVWCGSHGYLNDLWLTRNNRKDRIRYEYYCCNLTHQKDRSRTHCYTSYTSFTYDGDGKNYYLDRQTVQCSSRYFLTYFKLQRNSRHDRWRYHYTCCQIRS